MIPKYNGTLEKMTQRRRQRKAVHDTIPTVTDFLPRTEHRTLPVMLIPAAQGGALTASAPHPLTAGCICTELPRQTGLSVCLSLFPGGLPPAPPVTLSSVQSLRAYGLFVCRPSAPGTGPVQRAVKNTPAWSETCLLQLPMLACSAP